MNQLPIGGGLSSPLAGVDITFTSYYYYTIGGPQSQGPTRAGSSLYLSVPYPPSEGDGRANPPTGGCP